MSENSKRGFVWSFFDKVDPVNKEAECKLCHNTYKYKGTSHNLKLHLKFKHNEIFSSLPESERSDRRSGNSSVWLYFRPVDDDGTDKRAICLSCQKTCSYKTTIGNLKTHLRHMHNDLYEKMLGGDEPEYYLEVEEEGRETGSHDEGADDNANTSVWSFYEREAGGRARCVVCRAVVTRADLKAHLKDRHPKLVAEVDFGSDDEPSDSQEDVYTEIVYLEDEQNDKKGKLIPKKRKAKSTVQRTERKREPSSSSDELPLRQKKTRIPDEKPENNDEIEQFGKYVTCLLRKIPPAACMELQADIINLIMKKQLELKRNETSLLAGTDKMAEGSENALSTSLNTSNGYSNATENKD